MASEEGSSTRGVHKPPRQRPLLEAGDALRQRVGRTVIFARSFLTLRNLRHPAHLTSPLGVLQHTCPVVMSCPPFLQFRCPSPGNTTGWEGGAGGRVVGRGSTGWGPGDLVIPFPKPLYVRNEETEAQRGEGFCLFSSSPPKDSGGVPCILSNSKAQVCA